MDIQAVREEIATTLRLITGLRAYAFDTGQIQPPAALPGWPDRLDYVQTYQRGTSHVPDLPVLLLVGAASNKAATSQLAAFVNETGVKSIPAKLEGNEGNWQTCDTVTVSWVGFPAATYGGVDYLAAEFHLDITGKGA